MKNYQEIRRINNTVEAVLIALAVLVLTFSVGGPF